MEKFIDGSYEFETTNEFPDGYEIGRLVEEISSTRVTCHCVRLTRTTTSKEIP